MKPIAIFLAEKLEDLVGAEHWLLVNNAADELRRLQAKVDKLEAAQQEPVAWINWCAATGKRSVSFECESELASQPLYEGITQNTQDHYSNEPVAWADLNALTEQFNSVNCGTAYRLPGEGRQPLYTSPQPSKPLTDEQRRETINRAWNEYLRGEGHDSFGWYLSQATEAAHGIKGNT